MRVRFRSVSTGCASYLWLEAKVEPGETDEHTGPSRGKVYSVTVLGRDKSAIKELLMEGRRLKRDRLQKFLHVITVFNYKQQDYGLGWNVGRVEDKKPPGRSIDSVILPLDGAAQCQARALLEDAREFLGVDRVRSHCCFCSTTTSTVYKKFVTSISKKTMRPNARCGALVRRQRNTVPAWFSPSRDAGRWKVQPGDGGGIGAEATDLFADAVLRWSWAVRSFSCRPLYFVQGDLTSVL
jgi:hypothetical protein